MPFIKLDEVKFKKQTIKKDSVTEIIPITMVAMAEMEVAALMFRTSCKVRKMAMAAAIIARALDLQTLTTTNHKTLW